MKYLQKIKDFRKEFLDIETCDTGSRYPSPVLIRFKDGTELKDLESWLLGAFKEIESEKEKEFENKIRKLAGTYLLPIDTDFLINELKGNHEE